METLLACMCGKKLSTHELEDHLMFHVLKSRLSTQEVAEKNPRGPQGECPRCGKLMQKSSFHRHMKTNSCIFFSSDVDLEDSTDLPPKFSRKTLNREINDRPLELITTTEEVFVDVDSSVSRILQFNPGQFLRSKGTSTCLLRPSVSISFSRQLNAMPVKRIKCVSTILARKQSTVHTTIDALCTSFPTLDFQRFRDRSACNVYKNVEHLLEDVLKWSNENLQESQKNEVQQYVDHFGITDA